MLTVEKEGSLLQDVEYSIVIPAYNEAHRLGATLERVLGYIEEQGLDAEILVVNDGSTDNTAGIVRSFAEKSPSLRLIENPGNRGKGYSVRNGMLNARGRILLFSDADLSSPIEEAAKLFSALAEGADIAIGSRWLRAELQTQRQPLHRKDHGGDGRADRVGDLEAHVGHHQEQRERAAHHQLGQRRRALLEERRGCAVERA